MAFKSTNQQYCIATLKIATEAMSKNTLSLKERGQQAMNEFIWRFNLLENTTTGNFYYVPIKNHPGNLFKESNTKKKLSVPGDGGKSFADILFIFDNKSFDLARYKQALVHQQRGKKE